MHVPFSIPFAVLSAWCAHGFLSGCSYSGEKDAAPPELFWKPKQACMALRQAQMGCWWSRGPGEDRGCRDSEEGLASPNEVNELSCRCFEGEVTGARDQICA